MGILELLRVNIRVKDLIDILIVSIMVYQFMIMAKGTRAVQIMIGVAILSVFYWLGTNYEFYTLNWVLKKFFDSFIIILVILFQDQIRAALASMASHGKFFAGLDRQQLEEEIGEIIDAIMAMSKEKVGALIVFERSQGLSNFIETGTILNAKIHSDILYAIFQSKGSLHDGAVIVSSGTIAAAGCFLPLTKNSEIDRHYGTRHRAAIGVTEVTDAVVIIASEETGEIKVCLNREFYPAQSAEHLRMMLKHLWANQDFNEGFNELINFKGKKKSTS